MKRPKFNLVITGDVEKFATVEPKSVRLNGLVGDELSASVKIIPEKKYPFKITSVRAKNGKFITVKVDELDTPQEKGYLLTIDNLKNEKGRYYDTVFLKPDNKALSELSVRVYGNIKDKNKPSPQKPVPGTGTSPKDVKNPKDLKN